MIFSPYNQEHRAGFTLVELMVVVVIIGIVAAMAIPRFQLAMIKGHVANAEPLLAAIAGKIKGQYNEYGVMSLRSGLNIGGFSSYDPNNGSEDYLVSALGLVGLRNAGDFCFMVRYYPASGLLGTALPSAPPSFEVWAVLRGTDNNTSPPGSMAVTDASGVHCTPVSNTPPITPGSNNKQNASGSFGTPGSGPGSEGLVAVLHYPPSDYPPETIYTLPNDKKILWADGITLDDTIQ